MKKQLTSPHSLVVMGLTVIFLLDVIVVCAMHTTEIACEQMVNPGGSNCLSIQYINIAFYAVRVSWKIAHVKVLLTGDHLNGMGVRINYSCG